MQDFNNSEDNNIETKLDKLYENLTLLLNWIEKIDYQLTLLEKEKDIENKKEIVEENQTISDINDEIETQKLLVDLGFFKKNIGLFLNLKKKNR